MPTHLRDEFEVLRIGAAEGDHLLIAKRARPRSFVRAQ